MKSSSVDDKLDEDEDSILEKVELEQNGTLNPLTKAKDDNVIAAAENFILGEGQY